MCIRDRYVVSLTLTSDGAQKFKEATERNIGKPIYIVYDNEIISYPTVNTVIENGQAVIEGNFTYESSNNLATYIRLGALKLNLNEIRSNVVGAKLGDEALSTSLKAGAIGLDVYKRQSVLTMPKQFPNWSWTAMPSAVLPSVRPMKRCITLLRKPFLICLRINRPI